jgi:MoaA/NifB/PqqE/SkfB family radical SAM enzyme
VITGFRRLLTRLDLWERLARQAFRLYGSPGRALTALRAVARARRTAAGGLAPRKYVVSAGRAFFSLHAPGYPSRAFDRYAELELNRALPLRPATELQFAFIAITRRCGLQCLHCSEWATLRQPDVLSVKDLCDIAEGLRAAGTVQILLTGGEPLMRLDAAEAICRSVGEDCDVWALTSGVPLTPEVARRFREAGATGVRISLDHVDPAKHDRFRGVPGTFARAVAGARNAREAGLLVALSLTATRDFVTADNLERYATLARDLGAGFIEVLDPRPVGRWTGADVALPPEQLALLEAFDRSMNLKRPDMPLVDYPGIGQRRDGCWGAGDRYLFVDAAGTVHACPFCHGGVGGCLDEPLQALRGRLRTQGCQVFPPARTDARI